MDVTKLLKIARDIDAGKHLARLLSHNGLGDGSKPALDFWKAMNESMGKDPHASTFFDVPTWKAQTRELAIASMHSLLQLDDVREDMRDCPWFDTLLTSLSNVHGHGEAEHDDDFADNEVDDASMTESDSAETDDAALWEEAVEKTMAELEEYIELFVMDDVPRPAREIMFKMMMASLRKNFQHVSTAVEEEDEHDDE